MLGLDAVRNAVLSVEIYELFTPQNTDDHAATHFDRVGFWKHCIAVAAAGELIAQKQGPHSQYKPGEIFVCGLLHDLGKIALDRLLPKAYDRVVELADIQQANIAELERQIIGLDHHTVGRRLSEQWGLPHAIQDVLWLHGQPYETLPDLPHKPIIGLVSLADLIARKYHLGYSGNHRHDEDPFTLADILDLKPTVIEQTIAQLHETVSEKAETLGLENEPTQQVFLDSIAQANRALGRINSTLEKRSRTAASQERILRAISEFHRHTTPGQTITAVCSQVTVSASNEFGRGFFAFLCPMHSGTNWQLCQFHNDGRLIHSRVVEPPSNIESLETFGDDMQLSINMLGLLPWLSELALESQDIRKVQILPLRNGFGLSAILLHDRNIVQSSHIRLQLQTLFETWASAIAAAGQHEGARRLGDQLAESNRILMETQAKLAKTQTMAALGELAAGAAHEMNNPLTVISGRSQVLVRELTEHRQKNMAEQIVQQAHKLSDLITSLHIFAEPQPPEYQEVNLTEMIGLTCDSVQDRVTSEINIRVNVEKNLPKVWIDNEQIGLALSELIVNALESNPEQIVEVTAHIDQHDDRMVIEVQDDGTGLSPHALAHAFDPFFSEKAAGRQSGLGLARAQRMVTAHGGSIDLVSGPNQGTTARITLPKWRVPPSEEQQAA